MYPRKVLYVEDDEGDIKTMKNMIDNNKFEIIAETNGEKAIEIIKNDKNKLIKAILLDLELLKPGTNLGQKLQGDEVAKEIKKIRPEIPIFTVSKHVGKKISFIGCYPKKEIFKPGGIKGLEDALEIAIYDMESKMFSPSTVGTKWKEKWEKQWLDLKNNPNFSLIEKRISEEANKDMDLLKNNKISGTYRSYRGANNLENALIARRVIFATYFKFFGQENVLDSVADYLNMDDQGLKNFMHELGIAWGSIENRGTLLKEEEEWLKENGYLSYLGGKTRNGKTRKIIIKKPST